VSILDGGLPKWIAEGHFTVSGPQGEVSPSSFKATYTPSLVHNMEQMMDILSSKSKQVFSSNTCTKLSVIFIARLQEVQQSHAQVAALLTILGLSQCAHTQTGCRHQYS